MASTSSSTITISSSSTIVDGKALRNSPTSPQCVSLPTLPPPTLQAQIRQWKPTLYCRKIVARNVMAMATGEAPSEIATTETPEIVKTVQEAWDKVEDKYAVSSLGVVALIALVGSTGLVSAIDKLPLIPGIFEVVGIGYTGFFVYKNLVFKPERNKGPEIGGLHQIDL
ncbi:hypothetical protein PIB30_048092 [Stylosanthes scabra]|uniref:Cyanobacterial aminoacyl-tRNA synthetase CAAD domain-containing protein n=1 Tax=Stylosanthes scabra TaxID=79078 RepID=A0ABU6WGV7_9FABA|nr:hypothetical protein [Stylosanthes scabra]